MYRCSKHKYRHIPQGQTSGKGDIGGVIINSQTIKRTIKKALKRKVKAALKAAQRYISSADSEFWKILYNH
jgi:hypothetical protein